MIVYSVGIPGPFSWTVSTTRHSASAHRLPSSLLFLHYSLINILIGVDIQGAFTERNLKCSGAMSHTDKCFSQYFCFTNNVTWPKDWQNCITKPKRIYPRNLTECSREQLLPEVPRPSNCIVTSHQHWGETTESHDILEVTNCQKSDVCGRNSVWIRKTN